MGYVARAYCHSIESQIPPQFPYLGRYKQRQGKDMKSEMRLVKSVREFIPVEEVNTVGRGIRGIYVLYNKRRKKNHRGRNYMDVVYVGMARSGIAGRLKKHKQHKDGDWTHFTLFEVHDNTTDLEIEDL
jgi:hypothetical protein